jgi:hypothetical protein
VRKVLAAPVADIGSCVRAGHTRRQINIAARSGSECATHERQIRNFPFAIPGGFSFMKFPYRSHDQEFARSASLYLFASNRHRGLARLGGRWCFGLFLFRFLGFFIAIFASGHFQTFQIIAIRCRNGAGWVL